MSFVDWHHSELSFLQTDRWNKFQKSLGAECFYINDVLVIKYKLPFGKSYLYVPRANKIAFQKSLPTSLLQREETTADPSFQKGGRGRILEGWLVLRSLWRRVGEKGEEVLGRDIIFLRVEPEVEASDIEFTESLQKLGFKKVSHESMPSSTLILDLNKSEKELMAGMHQKTRYNIRLAEKKGVNIEIKDSLTEEEFEAVWGLIKKTSLRDNFSSFPKDYYKKLLDIFGGENIIPQKNVGFPKPYIKIVLGRREQSEKSIIAAAIVMFYGDTATYLHGASDYKHRNMMAPYIVQWSAMREAKKAGYAFYDFWGISENKWPGVTRFKKGFGGKEVSYVGAYDLVFKSFWYYTYLISKKFRGCLINTKILGYQLISI